MQVSGVKLDFEKIKREVRKYDGGHIQTIVDTASVDELLKLHFLFGPDGPYFDIRRTDFVRAMRDRLNTLTSEFEEGDLPC